MELAILAGFDVVVVVVFKVQSCAKSSVGSDSTCFFRERERQTDRERETETVRERETDRQTDRQTDRDRERGTE